MARRRALPILPDALRTAPPDPAGWSDYPASGVMHDWTSVRSWNCLRDALSALATHRDALRTAIAQLEAGSASAVATAALAEQRQRLLVACAKLEALRWAIGDTASTED